MIRLCLASVFVLACLAPATAFQKFEQYRIVGSEIRSVRLGPQQEEDPAILIIELAAESSGPHEITIESDDGLDACAQTIEDVIGVADSYIQITVQLTADTMNGVMVTECARISIP